MIVNIFNPLYNKEWTDTKINEKGRILIVVFLFNTESVLNIMAWIKKVCIFEQEMFLVLFFFTDPVWHLLEVSFLK